MAMAFSSRRLPRSRRTAVLTNSGGPGILAADALETHALELVELHAETVAKLTPLFPAEASIRNPLDMIASAKPEGYRTALDALLTDGNVDSAVAIFVPPLGISQEDVAEAIVGVAARHPEKPVLAVLMGREGLPQGRAELHRAGIPAYIFPESAARGLAALRRQHEWQERPVPDPIAPVGDQAKERAGAVLRVARAAGRRKLTELEALDLLDAYGIPTAPARLARDAAAAAGIAADIGYPIVLKIVSPQIIHKTDVGGVRVDIGTPDELHLACGEMLDAVRGAAPDAEISGILVQRMVRGGGSRETIAGLTRDRTFGPMLMFGLGGVFVEALGDVVFRLAPIHARDAQDMIQGLRGAALLRGIRGAAPADLAALTGVLLRLSQLGVDWPEIEELDINPLLAFPDRALAVDARVLLGGHS